MNLVFRKKRMSAEVVLLQKRKKVTYMKCFGIEYVVKFGQNRDLRTTSHHVTSDIPEAGRSSVSASAPFSPRVGAPCGMSCQLPDVEGA